MKKFHVFNFHCWPYPRNLITIETFTNYGIIVFIVAVAKQIDFINTMVTHFSQIHIIKRSNIYEDLMELFENEDVLSEYPLHISFADELGVDAGII